MIKGRTFISRFGIRVRRSYARILYDSFLSTDAFFTLYKYFQALMPMDIEIIETKENPLLNRKEVEFLIDENQTPDRIAVKEKLAAMNNADFDLVFIKEIKARFGKTAVTGFATIYGDEESSKIEPVYMHIRNLKKDERDEARKEYRETKRKKRKK